MRFIHMADVHLGAAPDSRFPWSAQRADEIWETFRQSVLDAGRKKADLLLIAGDLFHRQPTRSELREVDSLFARIPGTRVVIIAGNHDCLEAGSAYLDYPWSRNVVCLFSPEPECVRFPEIRTEVYGFSYNRREITQNLYDNMKPENSGGGWFRILLAHGGDARHIPISVERLSRSEFDYIALGHIHKMAVLVKDKAAFCGSLEPIEQDDLGEHGYLFGETFGRRARISFVRKAVRRYREALIECGPSDTTMSVVECLQDYIRENGPEDMYRVILTGTRRRGMQFQESMVRRCGRIVYFEDRTVPDLDVEELRVQYRDRLIGRFISRMDREKENPLYERALAYGLEALSQPGGKR